MTWNSEYFSTIGYLGLLASGVALVLWLLYIFKPVRLISTVALGLVVVGWFAARINSSSHVNRIQPDRTEELARMAAQEEARRKALVESRGDEVANIRFAEDGANDFLDRAGMDEADLKYFESQGGFGDPEWKKNKKKRQAGDNDDSLESAIGAGGEVIAGVDSEEVTDGEGDEPIIMSEADLVMANRLDLLNLRTTLILVIVGCAVFVFDYLRRANLYGKASYPLPLPSWLVNGINRVEPLIISSKRSKKSAKGELGRLARRGDSFLYLTDDPDRVKRLPSSFAKLRFTKWREDVISATPSVDDEFIFETVWHGRSSFALGDPKRSAALLDFVIKKLEERQSFRARVTQTAHLVWDLSQQMDPILRERLVGLAKDTGFSILLVRAPKSQGKAKSAPKNLPQESPLPS